MKYIVAILAVSCSWLVAITAMSVPCPEADCGGPPAGPDCQNVSEFSPNGCFPCRICLDEQEVNKSNLACPVNPFWFHTDRSEPICDVDSDCGPTEKCCFWSVNKHCLTGIDMAPRPGTCPPSANVSDCIADFPGCQYDSECGNNQKCCRNEFCQYNECKNVSIPAPPPPVKACTEIGCGPAPGPDCRLFETFRPNGPGCEPVCRVCADPPTTTERPRACTRRGCGGPPAGPDCQLIEEVRPNGPGCEPVCRICRDNTIRQDLECPVSWVITERTEPRCQFDTNCAAGEKCCPWGPSKHCLTGIVTLPKPGACPALNTSNCIADYSCRFDSECPGSQKCCENVGCGTGYKECSSIVPPNPAPVVKVCTEIGCGPAPSPDCRTFKFVQPNGPGCEPVCRVCADPPRTTTTTTTQPPRACTLKGCSGPPAGPDCQLIEVVRPNGPGCEPACRICRDKPDLACPVSQVWFYTERSEPKCQRDSDCRYGEKCCNWSGTKHCLTGINMAAKAGVCPASPPPLPGASLMNCRMDYVGCRYDSECGGDEKCCRNTQCNYGECVAPAPQIFHSEACTEIGCGPAPGPECQTFKYVRPNGPGCEPECRVCADPPTTTPAPTTPQICEMKWELICPRLNRNGGYASFREFGSDRDYYRPRCRYVRRQVCS